MAMATTVKIALSSLASAVPLIPSSLSRNCPPVGPLCYDMVPPRYLYSHHHHCIFCHNVCTDATITPVCARLYFIMSLHAPIHSRLLVRSDALPLPHAQPSDLLCVLLCVLLCLLDEPGLVFLVLLRDRSFHRIVGVWLDQELLCCRKDGHDLA